MMGFLITLGYLQSPSIQSYHFRGWIGVSCGGAPQAIAELTSGEVFVDPNSPILTFGMAGRLG